MIFESSVNRFATGHRLLADLPFVISSNITIIIAVAILIVIFHTEHSSGKGEYLTESHENGVVDFAGRWNDKTGNQQATANNNESDSRNELKRGFMLLEVHIEGVKLLSFGNEGRWRNFASLSEAKLYAPEYLSKK